MNQNYNMDFFQSNNANSLISSFADREEVLKLCKKHYPTGIPCIDKATGGGFEEGLTFIGANPGGGKSAFCGQFAVNVIKKLEIPICFFSLEMSKVDIIARLLSTESYKQNEANPFQSFTASKLLSKPFIENASDAEWRCVQEAVDNVGFDLYDMFFLFDGHQYTDADEITKTVEAFISLFHTTPVVIIDYLQYLNVPSNMINASDNAKLDYSIKALYRLAHNNRLLVLCISSLNKSSMQAKSSDICAYNGSGRIIYDADNLYILSRANNDESLTDTDKPIVDVDFVIRKARSAKTGVCHLKFNRPFTYFTDAEDDTSKTIPTPSVYTPPENKITGNTTNYSNKRLMDMSVFTYIEKDGE
ncbi:MAG: hypothetical protein K6F28_10370 [Lachnospiraceae bacterium]|nr:hypothetical protein [Lachnospiraceae bacterium]